MTLRLNFVLISFNFPGSQENTEGGPRKDSPHLLPTTENSLPNIHSLTLLFINSIYSLTLYIYYLYIYILNIYIY